uniref:Uncharacterized protein n=1 Tax=viral metagenome TaxID=1070528 RepID=A0A6C0D5P2_9ZZZZ
MKGTKDKYIYPPIDSKERNTIYVWGFRELSTNIPCVLELTIKCNTIVYKYNTIVYKVWMF